MDTTTNDKAIKFWATFEVINARRAIVEIVSTTGDWAGGGIVEVRDPSALYEACHRDASIRAAIHGGSLDRFSEAAQ